MTDQDPNTADSQPNPRDAAEGSEQPPLPPCIETTASAVMRILAQHRARAVAVATEQTVLPQ